VGKNKMTARKPTPRLVRQLQNREREEMASPRGASQPFGKRREKPDIWLIQGKWTGLPVDVANGTGGNGER